MAIGIKLGKKYNVNEHNMVKNPNCQEADQLAIYQHDQGVQFRTIKSNTSLVVRVALEPTTSRFQVQHPNHLATLPRKPTEP